MSSAHVLGGSLGAISHSTLKFWLYVASFLGHVTPTSVISRTCCWLWRGTGVAATERTKRPARLFSCLISEPLFATANRTSVENMQTVRHMEKVNHMKKYWDSLIDSLYFKVGALPAQQQSWRYRTRWLARWHRRRGN